MNKVTLKQWHMFQAVVKYGGFAQASEKIFKSTSSVHHSVNKLEEMLNVSLLKVEGRKTRLTSHGKKILCLVEKLLSDACNLETYVAGLTSLQDANIKIAVDELFPIGILRSVLQSTSNELSLKQLEITQVSTASFDDEYHSDVVLSVLNSAASGFAVKSVVSVRYVAVVGTKNSAFDSTNVVSANTLNKHIEITVDRNAASSSVDSSINNSCWKVDKLSSAIELVCEGIGYAWLPYPDVQHLIAEGKLRKIVFFDQPNIREIDFYLNVRQDFSLKPGVESIVHHFKSFDSSHKFEPMALSEERAL
ncbi:DNA-binding transcriptional regulator, LysR family [Rheinheimera pacifica]|uniref:DNA-binding transcriptional regulator, LysR family n=1 Tax=Rheinheimera pacifica TaxID=173990 RepID=A0A1H6KL33_9GAMM|nr:LysR family transcriptional regulator [Rheinheimera pacifica]SEH72555.1 DNA-binding transcriptional regulator, LysR family [Rheinheimera pacifica]